jgi:hypothetical protein
MTHVYFHMVGLDGLEPTTSVLSGPRSNHLSYRPALGECLENYSKRIGRNQEGFF